MSIRVLIVDDEKDFLDILTERMRSRGLQVSATTSAIDALQKVEEEDYDVILLDLVMPEMDGFKALKLIKQKRSKIQIILITGHITSQEVIEAKNLGAFAVVEKPADLKLLTDLIKKAKFQKAPDPG